MHGPLQSDVEIHHKHGKGLGVDKYEQEVFVCVGIGRGGWIVTYNEAYVSSTQRRMNGKTPYGLVPCSSISSQVTPVLDLIFGVFRANLGCQIHPKESSLPGCILFQGFHVG